MDRDVLFDGVLNQRILLSKFKRIQSLNSYQIDSGNEVSESVRR